MLKKSQVNEYTDNVVLHMKMACLPYMLVAGRVWTTTGGIGNLQSIFHWPEHLMK